MLKRILHTAKGLLFIVRQFPALDPVFFSHVHSALAVNSQPALPLQFTLPYLTEKSRNDNPLHSLHCENVILDTRRRFSEGITEI